MTHFFFVSSVRVSLGMAMESLNLVGCSSDILSISNLNPSVTFSPVCFEKVGGIMALTVCYNIMWGVRGGCGGCEESVSF